MWALRARNGDQHAVLRRVLLLQVEAVDGDQNLWDPTVRRALAGRHGRVPVLPAASLQGFRRGFGWFLCVFLELEGRGVRWKPVRVGGCVLRSDGSDEWRCVEGADVELLPQVRVHDFHNPVDRRRELTTRLCSARSWSSSAASTPCTRV